VCWRHTNGVEETWIFILGAADSNVWTLVIGARRSAPYPWRRGVCKRCVCLVLGSIMHVFRFRFECGGAEAVGRTKFDFGKLRL
jgi:hypothetical protein